MEKNIAGRGENTTNLPLVRFGGLDADEMPDVAPEVGHIVDGPLVQVRVVPEAQAIFGVHILQEPPHGRLCGALVAPELGGRHFLCAAANSSRIKLREKLGRRYWLYWDEEVLSNRKVPRPRSLFDDRNRALGSTLPIPPPSAM